MGAGPIAARAEASQSRVASRINLAQTTASTAAEPISLSWSAERLAPGDGSVAV